MDQWQPIDTAPKDGTTVLIWAGEVMVARWEGNPAMGWADWVDADGFRFAGHNVTHWMPLPDAPT